MIAPREVYLRGSSGALFGIDASPDGLWKGLHFNTETRTLGEIVAALPDCKHGRKAPFCYVCNHERECERMKQPIPVSLAHWKLLQEVYGAEA